MTPEDGRKRDEETMQILLNRAMRNQQASMDLAMMNQQSNMVLSQMAQQTQQMMLVDPRIINTNYLTNVQPGGLIPFGATGGLGLGLGKNPPPAFAQSIQILPPAGPPPPDPVIECGFYDEETLEEYSDLKTLGRKSAEVWIRIAHLLDPVREFKATLLGFPTLAWGLGITRRSAMIRRAGT